MRGANLGRYIIRPTHHPAHQMSCEGLGPLCSDTNTNMNTYTKTDIFRQLHYLSRPSCPPNLTPVLLKKQFWLFVALYYVFFVVCLLFVVCCFVPCFCINVSCEEFGNVSLRERRFLFCSSNWKREQLASRGEKSSVHKYKRAVVN